MTRRHRPKLATYLAVGAISGLAAVALGRPGLAAVAAPFLLFVLCGVVVDGPPGVEIGIEADPERIVEGESVQVSVRVRARRRMRLRVELSALARPAVLAVVGPREPGRFELTVTPKRWGGYLLGPARVEASDVFGLVDYEGTPGEPVPVRVYPAPQRLRDGVLPRWTRAQPGSTVSHLAGDGVELDGIRRFTAGDRVRRINWRVSARTGELHVTERLLERGADIVLLLDTFAAARDGASGTLEQAVRAADALAAQHLARGDRVGVVAFGGIVHWLAPGGGARTRMRILEALIETEVVFSYAWKDARLVPRRVLPADALVLAITPLLDERGLAALLDLRARGFDIAAIVIPPFTYARAASAGADRLWRLQHDALRLRLSAAGIAAAYWPSGAPLADTLGEVGRRRRTR